MKNINIRKLYYHARHRYMTTNNIVVLVALIIGASWTWASVQALQRNYTLQRELDTKKLEQRLVELETQNLTFEQRYYQTGEYKELAMRERVGVVLPGEKVLFLPPNSAQVKMLDARSTETPVANEPRQASNFEQWIAFLFGGKADT
jgi:hypothetical protein